jgi:hypothetical protein
MRANVNILSVKGREIKKNLSRWAWKRPTFKESVKVRSKIKLHTDYGGYVIVDALIHLRMLDALIKDVSPPFKRANGDKGNQMLKMWR